MNGRNNNTDNQTNDETTKQMNLRTILFFNDSNNVNNAFRIAKEKKLHTVGFLGKSGGDAIKLVDHPILIPSQSTARIQEMHITLGHILCELIEEGLGISS